MREKFKRFIKTPQALLYLLIAAAVITGSWRRISERREEEENAPFSAPFSVSETEDGAEDAVFNRSVSALDYSGVAFNPWDTESAAESIEKRRLKPYTIMIYMNGSDLESEEGAATHNLNQALNSGLKPDYANVIVFTGGTYRWQNDVIPDSECALWEVSAGELIEIARIGNLNMGDAGTLSSFIDFCMGNFPAEKYGLIMWDHGGGSIAGYGHDEKFNDGSLTLLELNYAFETSALSDTGLEFIGFDSCLMATVEMAVVASDYARWMIASEDLTPGNGWDYGFLASLNDNPFAGGDDLGREIADSFMEYYDDMPDEDLNISVIDLNCAGGVMYRMGELMKLCSDSISQSGAEAFKSLAGKRANTKTFGLGSPRDSESDMVDIADMADKLRDLFPAESAALDGALKKAVVYNRQNSDIQLGGLSAYYVFGSGETSGEALDTYASLKMDREYTGYLYRFYSNMSGNSKRAAPAFDKSAVIRVDLTVWKRSGDNENYTMTGIINGVNTGKDGEPEVSIDGLWPLIDGNYVCMYKISENFDSVHYAAPASLNGKDCDIIILISDGYPYGKILGARFNDGYVIQKGVTEIRDGDKISFYRPERRVPGAGETSWSKTGDITVKERLRLDWSAADEDSAYYLRFISANGKEVYEPLTASGY